MSTPIFDALLAESDDTTRALVWDAVNPAIDLGTYLERMNEFGRALAQVTAVEPEPELEHPGTWLPGDQIVDTDGETWTRGKETWTYGATSFTEFSDETVNESFKPGRVDPFFSITHLVSRTNGEVA